MFCMYSSPCPLLLQAKEGDEKALPLFAWQRAGRALRNSPVGCFSEGASLQGWGEYMRTDN